MKVDRNKLAQNQQQLDGLNKKHKALLRNKKNQIEHTKKISEQSLAQIRKDGIIRLDAQRARDNIEIEEALKHKTLRLEEAKSQIQDTGRFLVKQEKLLQDVHHDKVQKMNETQSEHIVNTNDSIAEAARKTNERAEEVLNKIDLETKNMIRDSRHKTKMKVDDSYFKNNLQIEDAKIVQTKSLRSVKEKNAFEEDSLVKSHRDQLSMIKEQQDKEVLQRQQIHSDKTKTQDKYNKDLILMERQSFQGRYDHLLAEHKEVINRLNDTFAKQINGLKLSHSSNFVAKQEKAQDSFYTGTMLEPEITEDKKSYYLSINVPEHEKDQFSISGDKRTIKISFARKYFDKTFNKEGLENCC